MDIASLQHQFASSRFLTFDENNGLVRISVKTPQATATIYQQGAHLTAFQPTGQAPVIFLSRKSDLTPGKPLRGGIPIVFPWFATDSKPDRIDGHPGPSHGFARTQDWTLRSANQQHDDVVLTFDLGPTAISRSMGFDRFQLSLVFTIGRTLTLALTVTNTDTKPLTFEEAFHTYYHVTDIHEVTVDGLEPTPYIDKTDNFKVKPPANAPLHFTQFTDRVYNDTAAPCTIHDGAVKRRIFVRKTNSNSTVVFNPWKELPDLGPWEWHEMAAVETANVGSNSIALAPAAAHTMSATISVEKA
jgi:glucose-6-phosphate 1-epimerase